MPWDMLSEEFFLFKSFSIHFIIFFVKPSMTPFTWQAFLCVLLQSSVVYPDNNAAIFVALC